MENTAMSLPLFDLFGEQVVIQRRVFNRQSKRPAPVMRIEQLGFLDILEMSDEELEAIRPDDEFSDDFVDWLRGYLITATFRQVIHPQVSAANRAELMEWIESDALHPFSFTVCCMAMEADPEHVRYGLFRVMRQLARSKKR